MKMNLRHRRRLPDEWAACRWCRIFLASGEEVTNRCFMFDTKKRELGLYLLNKEGHKYIIPIANPKIGGDRSEVAVEILSDVDFAVALKKETPGKIRQRLEGLLRK